MTTVFNDIYKPQKYKDLWFLWEGKPLMLETADSATTQEMRDFFTFRDTWAFQGSQDDQWRFIDDYPQRASYHNGVVEQMVVNKSMGAPLWPKGSPDNKGSSWTKHNADKGVLPVIDQYWIADSTPYGLYFQEQWNRADSVDAPMLFVTGWNEWTAGAWNADAGMASAFNFLGKALDQTPGSWFFVDEFNSEYNRDIEPMKGGYGDNYYYQLMANIRKYKGMPVATVSSTTKTIAVDGVFADWTGVLPLYKDPAGDTQARNYQNCDNSATLTNTTGRNDIIQSQVTHDVTNVYFHVKTAANLTVSTGSQWMELFLNSDKNQGTGWQGYDYRVRGAIVSTKREVAKWNGSAWVVAGQAFASVGGADMELSISKSLVGLGATPMFDFKWADNAATSGGMDIFVDNGDAAPDRRFNYRYTASVAANEPRAPYFASALALPDTIQVEDFDKGGEAIAYHDLDLVNSGGQYRTTGVDIEATPGGGYNVGWVSTGEWMEYSVSVAQAGSYVLGLRASSGGPGNDSVLFAWDGVALGSVGFVTTGGLHTYAIREIPVNLTAGAHVLRLNIKHSGGGFNLDRIEVRASAPVAVNSPWSSKAPSLSAFDRFYDLLGRLY
jgi:hypothetical protein